MKGDVKMPAMIDLTGQQFGRLTVLEKDLTVKKGKPIKWICRCECGNIKSIQGTNLRNGSTKSCGCLQKEKVSLDLLNKKFGKLTVIEKTNKRTPDRCIIWLCKCDCGNFCEVSGNNLIQDITKSCGCLKQSHGELMIENYLINNNIPYKKEYCFPDLKSNKNGYLRFDFAILDKNNNLVCLIEFDGETHSLNHLNGWLTKEKVLRQQENDSLKNIYCEKNKIKLTRISSLKEIDIILDNLFKK